MKRTISLMLFLAVFALGSSISAFAADLAHKDKSFVTKVASDGLMEVQLGQIAQQKGQSQEVKDFGSRMVADHTKANEEVHQLAQAKNINLPGTMERADNKKVDKYTKYSKADFDKKFMKDMVKDHEHDVKDFRKMSQDAKDPDVKAFAAKTLPVLEEHLQQAHQIAKKVGAE